MAKRLNTGESDAMNLNIMALSDKGKTQKQISQELNIAQSMVSLRLQQMKQAATNGVILSKTAETHIKKEYIDPVRELYTLHSNTQRVYEDALSKYDEMLKTDKYDVSAVLEISREIRGQLELQVKITEKIFNADRMRVFRDCIIETMEETHPKLKKEFIQRLNSKKEMYGTAVTF